jgi:hypothetical protein
MRNNPGTQRAATTLWARLAILLTLLVSLFANAQSAAAISQPGLDDENETSKGPAWRGSSLTYGLNASATTFSQAAEPFYNATVGHRLGLLPEWHFNKAFLVRARFFLAQEFTKADETTYKNEVEPSDLMLEGAYTGWTESHTGLRLSGDVRIALPTSKQSQFASRVFTLGPSVALSRNFNVLAGLSLSYSARFTYRFNRFATGQYKDATITSACADREDADCNFVFSNQRANTMFDILHGASVNLNITDKWSVTGIFLMQRGWIAPLAAAPSEFSSSTQLTTTGPRTRDLTTFLLAVNYQAFKAVGFSLGSYTLSPQLTTDSQYYFPLFNRNTSLYLEASFDVEAAVSSLKKK